MDRLEFFDKHELLRFLQVHKNELALLEKPRIFLNQLRDHHMIPEDRYEVRLQAASDVEAARVFFFASRPVSFKDGGRAPLNCACVWSGETSAIQ